MDRLEVLPSILWKVENFWSGDKKFRQPLSFLGMSWKLRLLCAPEAAGGVRLKLSLKRLGPMTLSHDAHFTVDTCVLSHYSSDQYFRQTLSASLQYREWGIWSQPKADIERQEHVNYRSGLVFLIVVTPADKWAVLLQNTYRKQSEVPEPNPCLQSLTRDLGSLLDGEDQHSDVVLSCGGRTFRAHRALLSARSVVFEAMFRSDMLESREGKVTITDIGPALLEQFLLYLYTGEVAKHLSAADARRLYAVADKYAVDALKIKCSAVVTESYRSGVETKLPRGEPNKVVYLTAQEKVDLRTKELTRDVLMTREWKLLSQEFPKLAADMFRPLMEVVEPPAPPPPKEGGKEEQASSPEAKE